MQDNNHHQGLAGRSWSRISRAVDAFVPAPLREVDPNTHRRARLVVSFVFVTVLLGAPFAALYHHVGSRLGSVTVCCGVTLAPLLLLVLRRGGSYLLAANLGVGLCFGTLTILSLFLGGPSAPPLAWYAAVPVLAGCMAGRRSGLAWTAVTVTSLLVLEGMHLSGFRFQDDLTPAQHVHVGTVALVAVVLLAAALTNLLDSFSMRMLKQVSSSEERFRLASESCSDLIYEWDLATGRLDWYGDVDGALGYEPDAFPRTLDAWLNAVHPDDRPCVEAAVSASRETGVPLDLEYRIQRKDGTWRWWTEHGVPVTDKRSRPGRFVGACTDITRRKLAEEELRRLNHQFEYILGATRTGVNITDSEYNLEYVDPEWQRAYGDPTGRKCYQYFMGRTEPCEDCAIPKALATRQIVVKEETLPLENNRIVEVHTIPFQDTDGKWKVAEFNVDVTARKEFEAELTRNASELERSRRAALSMMEDAELARQAAERAREALAKSQAQLQTILENLDEGLVVSDLDGRFVHWNHAALEMYGLADPGARGFELSQLIEMFEVSTIDGKVVPLNDWPIARILRGERLCNLELCVRHMTLQWNKIVSFSGAIVSDDNGRPLVAIMTCSDCTERKQSEQALRESEARHRQIFETVLDGMLLLAPDGTIVDANPAACAMHGYERDEFIGLHGKEIVCPSCHHLFEEFLTDLPRGRHFSTEALDVRKDGSKFPIEVRGVLVSLGNKPHLLAVVHDLTARRQAEEALRQSEEHHRILFESSRDAVMTLEPPDWKHSSGNPATLELFEAGDEAEFTSHTPWDLSPEVQPDGRSSAEKAKEMIETAMREGSHFFEWTHRRLDGALFPATVLFTRMEQGGRTFLQATVRDITRQKEAEEGLRKLSQAVEQSPAIVVITDPQGTIEYVNPRFSEVYGYTAEEAIGQNPRILKSDRTAPETFRQMWQTITAGRQWRGEVLNRAKDGTPIWELVSISPVIGSDGKTTHFVAVKEVITERKQAEERLHAAAEFQQKIIDTAATAVFTVDARKCITEVNEAFCQATGFSRDEVVGRDCSTLRGEPCDERCSLFDSEHPQEIFRRECVVRNKEGRALSVIKNAVVIRDGDGQVTGAIESFVDVTSLVEAREAATHESTKLRSMIEGMDEGIVVADANDVITEANTWFLTKFGLTRDELIGRSLWDFHPEAPGVARLREVLASFREGQSCEAYSADRELLGMHLSLRAQPIHDGERYRGVVLNVINVTSLVEARRAIEEANESLALQNRDLEQTNALLEEQTALANSLAAEAEAASAAKSEFLANMSHEIRTPMTSILGFAENLLEPELSPSDRINAIHTIRRNGDHLLQLINDILDISRIEAGRLEVERIRWSPVQLVSDVHSLMSVRAQAKGLPFKIEFVDAVPAKIRTDPTRLRQILVNLIGNAIKFTETGGVRLVIRYVAPGSGGDGDPAEPMMQFDVIDTGIGITAEQMDNLFKPFSQADSSTTRKFGGSGLGLTISRRLARMLGGDVSVQSIPGEGSTFRLRVATGPLDEVEFVHYATDSALSNVQVVCRKPPVEAPLSCRILLAEDGPDNQLLISHVLTKAGADVTVVENGRLAVRAAIAAQNEGRPFDVVLMDMQMPVMDGYEATSLLRQKGYTAPIIALTAHAMATDRQKCLDAGCADYASKPIDRNRLIRMIRDHLEGGHANMIQDQSHGDPLVSELAGDPDFADLVEMFVKELPTRIEAIERACREQDLDTLVKLAHQLKGSAGGYGFPSITEAAAELEQTTRANEAVDRLTEEVQKLTHLCSRARSKPHAVQA